MFEVFVKYLCFVMLTITGTLSSKIIIKEKQNIFTLKNLIIIFLFQIIPTSIYHTDYQSLNTFIIFFINIIIYKLIFKKDIVETTILSSYLMVLSFITDILTFLTTGIFIKVNQVRTIWYMMLICNFISSLYILLIIKIKYISNLLYKFIEKVKTNNIMSNAIFSILTFIVLTFVTTNIYNSMKFRKGIISSIAIGIIFIILFLMYLFERNSYANLSKQYDGMLTYVNEFEDWIEKEQFNRHEYKNQLAVLRCLTKEKNVKDKIDEILEDNINIEGNIVHELKILPKGGIKGLMYYKSSIAQKRKINLTINVSLDYKTYLNKLSKEEIRTLCKLIGVYYDNAIEAAAETRKKVILVEIYELKDKISFVFSNTFKKHSNFNNRNQKGISSKGEGRGNGLYFANKLLEKNGWIESKQEIIDNYYIQQISINKKASK